jgi:hypothetical protein
MLANAGPGSSDTVTVPVRQECAGVADVMEPRGWVSL